MSRILRRPMFRGGRVSSYGTGIASGLADGGMPNKRGLVDGPGGYSGVMDTYESIKSQIPERERQGLTRGDYLRIASAGLDILGAPGETGGILGGTLSAASKPLSKLGVDLGTALDAREQKAMEQREDLARTLTGAEIELQSAKIKSRTKVDAVKDYLDQVYEIKRKVPGANLSQIEKDYNRDFKLFVVAGLDLSDISNIIKGDEVQERIFDAAADALKAQGIEEGSENYEVLLINKAAEIGQQYGSSIIANFDSKQVEKKAEGGLTGTMTEDVNVMEQTPGGITDLNISETETMDPNQPELMQVGYDELRARLPKEIGDDIVNLLANSYEALADFAAITTQADVDNFNGKYGVELVLPQEA
jgi:hypothetical protein